LAILFAISTMLNSFGGGNMFQGWNVSNTLHLYFHVPVYVSATVVSALVAIVIIGGIRRIGNVASKLVPFMCVVYVAGALYVVVIHAADIPRILTLIVQSAFTDVAGAGGFAGATVWIAFTQGLRRACFSNEAGEGSAAMAHAAARTDEPIREGVVAGIGPFVDTLIICTMSALVLLMTGAWDRPVFGRVASVDESNVVVECNRDVPEHFQMPYLRAVNGSDNRKLAIILEHKPGSEPKTLVLDVRNKVEGAAEWSAVDSVVLKYPDNGIEVEDRARIALDQPVHLDLDGSALTSVAFDTVISGFGKWMVTLGVCLFGFSTMISWSYYGEKGAEYLFGPGFILPFKFLFVIFVFLGMVLPKFSTVYDFSDATTGLMVLCNLPAVLILSPHVFRAAKHYFNRLDKGDMPRQR